MAPGGGQELVECLHGFGGRLGQFAAAADEHVGGEHAGAAGIGEDGQARALRAGLFGEHFGHVEQFGDGLDAQHADAPEGGLENFIAAGERAGMGGGGFGGGFGAADFDDNDGLGEGDFAGGGEEGAGIADRFHVDDDALGVAGRRPGNKSGRPS